MLACTPYGAELEDPFIEDGEELVDGEVEEIYAWLPDDDREQPVEDVADALRCFEDSRPTQVWEVADPSADPEAGMMGVERDGKLLALPLQRTRFDTVIVGTVAETEVVQVFANPFDEPIEAVYLFPLHEQAAVDDYWLTIGDRSVRGEMKTREDARQTYEDAKKDGRAAGLLEQERPNVFTQRVANIPPGESIEVSIHVVQPLEQDHGEFALVLPTVVGPRFIPGTPLPASRGQQGVGPAHDTDQVPDASRITAPIVPEGFTTCADLSVSVAIESGLRPRALRSKFHDIDIRREGDVAFIELGRDAGPVLANRDFVLSWDLGQNHPQAAIVAQAKDDGSGGYFTLTVQPPELVPDEQATPRELVFVVDNSGSMGGAPIDTAKELMRRSLKGMRADDTFNVLRFSEQASGLAPGMLAATQDNRELGLAYVDDMSGMGGTQMLAGIDAALGLPHQDDRVRIVMFLTDGYIGNEAEIFSLIDQRIGDARLFSLGVGGAPNRYLLDGMARAGRGAVTYAAAGEDVDLVVDRFYERVATPVLTDIEIDWRGLAVAEVLPGQIPDLFAGQPLTVFGKYSGAPSGEIVVRGKAHGPEGARTVELPVHFSLAKAEDVEGVASIWARKSVDELLGYPSLVSSGRVDEDTKQAVIELALQYRIMTDYTSFVAVSEHRVVEPDGTIKTVVQPLELPEGTTYEGFTGVGGLGLVGTGAGGGGTGSGYGHGSGVAFGGRGKRVPRVRQAKAVVMGSLDKDVIRRVVRAHINEIRACYNAGLTKDPNLSGRVVLAMTIGADGKVRIASVDSNDSGDEAVGKCMAKVAKKWTFPKPAGGGEVTISYPFLINPG